MNSAMFPEQPEDHPSDHRRDIDRDPIWLDLLFPPSVQIASPQAYWVPDGPLGAARLANRNELLRLRDAAQRDPANYLRLFQGFAVAHDLRPSVIDMSTFPIPCGAGSPNILVFGQSGSGKTQMITLPAAFHAIREGWMMVYINIKGPKQTKILCEFAKSAGRLKELQLLVPRHAERSLKCSMLEGCDNVTTASEVAASMVRAAGGAGERKSADWCDNQAEEWLTHAIVAVCTSSPKSKRNLLVIRDVVLSGEFTKFAEAHTQFPVLKKFANYVASGNANAATVVATVGEATALIDGTRNFLSSDDFRFTDFAKKGGLCILEIDQNSIKRLRPLTTLLLGRLLGKLQEIACNDISGAIPHKTVIVIDELMAAGPIPGLAETLHTCREMGFSIVAGAQTLTQLNAIYGDAWPTVLAGFSSQIALPNGLDPSTANYFSERSGITTIALPSLTERPQPSIDIRELEHDYRLTSRLTLLPSDITFAAEHPELGRPATMMLGDGTPMFQAYLTPAFKEPRVAMLMERALAGGTSDAREPLSAPTQGFKPAVVSSHSESLFSLPKLSPHPNKFCIRLVEIGPSPQQVARLLSKLMAKKVRVVHSTTNDLPTTVGYCPTLDMAKVIAALIHFAGGVSEIVPSDC